MKKRERKENLQSEVCTLFLSSVAQLSRIYYDYMEDQGHIPTTCKVMI
jgi:hypothetical protein